MPFVVISELNIIISLVDICFQQLLPFNVCPECVWELSIQRSWIAVGRMYCAGGRSRGEGKGGVNPSSYYYLI